MKKQWKSKEDTCQVIHRNFSNPVLSADSEVQLPFEPVPKLRFRGNEAGNIKEVTECSILKIQLKVRF